MDRFPDGGLAVCVLIRVELNCETSSVGQSRGHLLFVRPLREKQLTVASCGGRVISSAASG